MNEHEAVRFSETRSPIILLIFSNAAQIAFKSINVEISALDLWSIFILQISVSNHRNKHLGLKAFSHQFKLPICIQNGISRFYWTILVKSGIIDCFRPYENFIVTKRLWFLGGNKVLAGTPKLTKNHTNIVHMFNSNNIVITSITQISKNQTIDSNSLKHSQIFWSPIKMCPRVNTLIFREQN